MEPLEMLQSDTYETVEGYLLPQSFKVLNAFFVK